MKKTHTDKAIESLEAKKAVIDLAIAELRAHQSTAKPKRERKAKTAKDALL